MRVAIEKMVHGGSGMGAVDGRKVFVPFSAPGDVLDVEVTSDRQSFCEARIERIARPAPCRVEPRCPVFGRCGGCQWQHISYGAQLEWKRAILMDALVRIGKIPDPNVMEALPSPKQWHYRNRMQLHVDSRGRVGYYRPRSKEVVEFESCAIADEDINRQLNERRDEISRRDRGIALRTGDGAGFTQVNSGQNENLKGLLADWLGALDRDSVLELHAGSGNFTFAMAGVAGRITATEIDGRAVEAAKAEQARRGICNVQFRRLAAGQAVARYAAACDAVLIDPPRRGCPEVVSALAEAAPASILYISCDPATLGRDVRALCDAGWRLVRTQPVDMFPQTFHIESLSLLTRLSG